MARWLLCLAAAACTAVEPHARVLRVPLSNIGGTNYVGSIAVGTPPQRLTFLPDTGSAATWVRAVRGARGEASGAFGTASSSSTHLGAGSRDIAYGDGTVRGTPGTETIHLSDGTVAVGQPLLFVWTGPPAASSSTNGTASASKRLDAANQAFAGAATDVSLAWLCGQQQRNKD